MKKILLLAGDGVGPECIVQAKKILHAIEQRFGCAFDISEALIGGAAYDALGDPLPKETVDKAVESDAVLFGSWGGKKWDGIPEMKPSKLLGLRKAMQVYLNVRPVVIYNELASFCPLKKMPDDLNVVVLRELLGGAYFGPKKIEGEGLDETASDSWIYSRREVRRIAEIAFDLASKRKGRLVSADKAGPLVSMDLWRKVMTEVSKEYPDVTLENIFVDNCAMQLITMPEKFDVIAAENCFGDILSDELSALTGLPSIATSVCLGDGPGLYEVSHGVWSEYAGNDTFNPMSVISLVAMMLRYNLDNEEGASCVERALKKVLSEGFRTVDMMEEGRTLVGMSAFSDLVAEAIVTEKSA